MKKLLLLHGALGTSSSFDCILPQLQSKFEVKSFNWLGHNDQNFNFKSKNSFKIEEFQIQLNDFLNENNWKNCWVLGYSMGGYVALYQEIIFPNSFEQIFTLGTKMDWNIENSILESKMLNPEKIEEKIPKYALKLGNLLGNNWRNVVNCTAEMMLELGKNPLLTKDKLKEIKIPIKFLIGDEDNMVTIQETEKFSSYCLLANYKILNQSKHPIEQVNIENLINEIRN